MISHKYKCIFIHIPKAAGQSIEKFFLDLHRLTWINVKRYHLLLQHNLYPQKGTERLDHLTVSEYLIYNYIDQNRFDEYFKFTFVRNPWERLVSEYNYRDYHKRMSFRNFVLHSLPQESHYDDRYRHILPQYNFLYDSSDKLLVDYVGRFENLQKDFDFVCSKLNIFDSKLPHKNASGKKNYKNYYDKETKKIVEKMYIKDIETFGYTFGDVIVSLPAACVEQNQNDLKLSNRECFIHMSSLGLTDLAKGKKAWLSSESKWSYPNDAWRAMDDDGKRGFAFHTGREDNPWWLIDLKESSRIFFLVIGNRRRICQGRANTLTVEISDDLQVWEILHTGLIFWDGDLILPLMGELAARYVKLSLRAKNIHFHLAKIEIWGTLDPKFEIPFPKDVSIVTSAEKNTDNIVPPETLAVDAHQFPKAERRMDLGKLHTLEFIKISKPESLAWKDGVKLKIEVSKDDQDWQLIHEGHLYWEGVLSWPLQGRVIGRYIRLSLDGQGSEQLSLFGLEVFPNRHRPPADIPDDLRAAYTLNQAIPVISYYFDNSKPEKVVGHSTKATWQIIFKALEEGTFTYGGQTIEAFYDAFVQYPLKDKTVIVWGLEQGGYEALAVWQGAKQVYVVDYDRPACDDHEKITFLTPKELAESNLKSDYWFSWSPFKRDGLGRFGEPLNPEGDLSVMKMAWEHLHDDGFMFLCVPLGRDCLAWNAHRIYGPLRLPLLLKYWLCLDAFHYPRGTDILKSPLGVMHQQLLVLQKIKTPFPDDEVLNLIRTRVISGENKPSLLTYDSLCLGQITDFIIKHKAEKS